MQAIVLNGNDVIKVTNLKRKRKKIENNPQMTILEEFENEISEERFEYWKSQYKKEEIEEEIQTQGCYPKILYYEVYRGDEFIGRVPDLSGLVGTFKVTCVYDKYNVTYDVVRNSE